MESSNGIILQDVSDFLGRHPDTETQVEEHQIIHTEFSLPQADGGKDAWLFLAAGFMVEAMVWGLPFSFGVFQEYYSSHEPFSDQNNIAVIGTTATGVMYMIGLALFPAYKHFPHLAGTTKWMGLPLMAASLIGASFAQTVNHLIATQGVLYAIGGCMIYYPTLMYIDEWFIQRKGLAYGIMWAGTGVGGLTIPFILNALLSHYTFRTTLRIWSFSLLLTTLPLVYFLRPRLPISPSSQSPRYGLSFLSSPSFWILQLGLLVESLGYFIPSLYLPLFARSLGFSPSIGTLLVALLNLAGVFATIVFGMLVDRFHVTTVILLSTIGTTLSVFILWGFSTALPLLCTFAVVYGFFAGGFVSTNAGVIKLVKGRDRGADVGVLLGVISAARGVGAIASGVLSEALVDGGMGWRAEGAYGTGYGGLIVFTGVSAAVGGVGFVGKRLGWV